MATTRYLNMPLEQATLLLGGFEEISLHECEYEELTGTKIVLPEDNESFPAAYQAVKQVARIDRLLGELQCKIRDVNRRLQVTIVKE